MKTLSIACLLVAGCASSGAGSSTSSNTHAFRGKEETNAAIASDEPAAPPRIVDAKFGKENSTRAAELVVPYGTNQNGTELVLVALQQAQQSRASYLGDLQIIATFKWNGAPVECRMAVVPEGDPRLTARPVAAAEPGAYTTNVQEFKPQLVKATAEETELVCKEKVDMVASGHETDIPDRNDPDRHAQVDWVRPAQPGDVKFVSVSSDDCHKERVKRDVERYDYQLKLGFVPPDWQYISKRYSDAKLATTPPVCYQVADPKEPMYRLTATAYYRANVARDGLVMPTRRASDEVLENMNRPQNMSVDAMIQNCKEMGRKDCDNMRAGDNGYFPAHGSSFGTPLNGAGGRK